MTSFADAAATIRSRFETLWPQAYGNVRVLWPNETLNPVPDPARDTSGFVAFFISSGSQRLTGFGGIGNNRYRQSGEVVINIFVPAQGGEALARQMASSAAAIFRGWQAGDLKFFSAQETSSAVRSDDGNFINVMDVVATFFFDLIG